MMMLLSAWIGAELASKTEADVWMVLLSGCSTTGFAAAGWFFTWLGAACACGKLARSVPPPPPPSELAFLPGLYALEGPVD